MTFAVLAPLKFIVTPATGEPSAVVIRPLITAGAAVGAKQPGNMKVPMRVFQAELLVAEKYSLVCQKVQLSDGSMLVAL